MSIDLRDYLEIEYQLGQALSEPWKKIASRTYAEVAKAIKAKDFDKATAIAEALDLSEITPQVADKADLMFRAAIDFGAQVASKGNSLTSSLMFDRQVKQSVTQLSQYLEWGATQAMQDRLLQLIAEARAAETEEVKKFNPYHDEAGRFTTAGGSQAGSEHEVATSTMKDMEKWRESIPTKYNPTLFAVATTISGQRIELGPKFKALPAEFQSEVLTHEAAHFHGMDDWHLKNSDNWDLAALSIHGNMNGQTTPGEVIVEAYARAWHDPEFLKKTAPDLIPHVYRAAVGVGAPIPEVLQPKKEVKKYNPYHDELGRFTSKDKAGQGGTIEDRWVAAGGVGPLPSMFSKLTDPEDIEFYLPREAHQSRWKDRNRRAEVAAEANAKAISESLTEEERSVLEDYSWHGFGSLNLHLRGDSVPDHMKEAMRSPSELKHMTEVMDGIMAKSTVGPKGEGVNINEYERELEGKASPDEYRLYRGLAGNIPDQIGEVITEKGYASTSTVYHVATNIMNSQMGALGLSDGVVLSIKVKSSTRGIPLSRVVSETKNKGYHENEILLPRGVKYRITGVRKANPPFQPKEIEVEVISEGEPMRKVELQKKAPPLKPFVSFKEDGDKLLQLISSLHASRLSGWGFIAESDLRGQVTYKLTAVLDNRTSKFCRMIHGKTFTVESARGLLDQAVHADNPEDLRTIHPWPKQTNASIEELSGLSSEELAARGYHVPPFHPGCRTLMVPVDYKSKLKLPEVREQVIPDSVSTLDTFKMLDISMTEAQLRLWNDYVGMNPATVLGVLSNKPLTDILAGSGVNLRVTPKGTITFGLDKTKVKYDPHTGTIGVSAQGQTDLEAYQAYKLGITAFAKSVGADLQLKIVPGEALNALRSGIIPAADDWQSIKATLSGLIVGSLKGSYSKLLPSDRRLVLDVLNSNLESKFLELGKLPEGFLNRLLSDVQYYGQIA